MFSYFVPVYVRQRCFDGEKERSRRSPFMQRKIHFHQARRFWLTFSLVQFIRIKLQHWYHWLKSEDELIFWRWRSESFSNEIHDNLSVYFKWSKTETWTSKTVTKPQLGSSVFSLDLDSGFLFLHFSQAPQRPLAASSLTTTVLRHLQLVISVSK